MTNDQVQAAIFDAEGIEEVWVAALTKDGEQRDGSSVCEASLVCLSSLPERTRLIVRREPLHPDAYRETRGGAARVGPADDLAPDEGCVLADVVASLDIARQLRDRRVEDQHMVSGGVRAGIARPEHSR
jgi:hypothetical protein